MLEIDLMQSFPPEWFDDGSGEDSAIDWTDAWDDEDPVERADIEDAPKTIDIESLDVISLPSVPFDDRRLLPSTPGVYFVYFVRGEQSLPLYIGETKGLLDRWKNHEKIPALERIQSVIGSLTIFYLETADHKKLEFPAIQKFEPFMNYQFKKRIGVPATKTEIEERFRRIQSTQDELRASVSKNKERMDALRSSANGYVSAIEESLNSMSPVIELLLAENTRLRNMYIQVSLENQSLKFG